MDSQHRRSSPAPVSSTPSRSILKRTFQLGAPSDRSIQPTKRVSFASCTPSDSSIQHQHHLCGIQRIPVSSERGEEYPTWQNRLAQRRPSDDKPSGSLEEASGPSTHPPRASSPYPRDVPVSEIIAKKTIDTFEAHFTCSICTDLMWSPFTLPCGHTFCGICLRRHFESQLAAKLRNIRSQCYNHPTKACQAIPTTDSQRFRLKKALRHHGENPDTGFFVYSCPMCRDHAKVYTAPNTNYTVQAYVRDTYGEFEREFKRRKTSPGEGCVGGDPFAGLFIRTWSE